MSHSRVSWGAIGLAAVVASAGVYAYWQPALAADDNTEPEGRIVQIGPARDGAPDLPAIDEQQDEASNPGYWIGISGRNIDSDVLRTQLQLAEDMGVVVESVVPDSPADKAGIRKHDIILRANGNAVDSMTVLQDLVSQDHEKPIDLKLLRLGKEIDITVTPEQRPEDFNNLTAQNNPLAVPNGQADPFGGLLRRFNGAGIPGGFRVFGPGLVFNNKQFDLNSMPNGLSISITRENNQPAKVTVKKGDQTWTFSSDDAKALAQLPQDVRDYVSGLLNGQGIDLRRELGNIDWQAELQHMLPDALGNLPAAAGIQQHEDEVLQRMNKLEKQLQQLQKQIEKEKESK